MEHSPLCWMIYDRLEVGSDHVGVCLVWLVIVNQKDGYLEFHNRVQIQNIIKGQYKVFYLLGEEYIYVYVIFLFEVTIESRIVSIF